MSDAVPPIMVADVVNGTVGPLVQLRPGSWSVTTGDLILYAGLSFAIGFIVCLIIVLLIYGWKRGGGRRVNVAQ